MASPSQPEYPVHHDGGPSGAKIARNQSRLGLILGLLVTAQFIVVLDFSIVQIALPTIRDEMNVSLTNLQWIVGAYGLTFAGLLMLSGRASDLYGRKNLFIAGLAIFSISSLTGGLASSEGMLILARALQGIGAALASAAGLALIVTTFAPLGRLNWALGIFTAVSSAGFSAGIILGGVITDALGWRWVFFVNVPIGIVAAALAISVLPTAARVSGRHLDFPGAVSITAGLMLLVYALTNVGSGDLSARTFGLFGLAAVVLLSFLVIENRSRGPLMPLGFLKRRTVFLPNAVALLVFAANTAMVFVMTLYLQQVEGYSALDAGFALVPPALIYFILGGFVAPRLVRRIGAKSMLIMAMLFLALGLFFVSSISVNSNYWTGVLAPLLVAAVGGSLALTGSNIAALGGARSGEEGIASGLINTSRQVGGPIGLAFIVTIIDLVTSGLGASASPTDLVLGFRYALGTAAGFAVLGMVFALLMTDTRNQVKAIFKESSPTATSANEPQKTPVTVE